MHVPSNPAIPLVLIYPEDIAATIRKYIFPRLFIAALFAIENTGNYLKIQTYEKAMQ